MPMTPAERAKWLPYYTLLGEVISTWDRLVGGLEYLFMMLVDPQTTTAQPRAIFHSARSTQTQLTMIQNAMETAKIDVDLQKTLNDLLNRVSRSNRVRNGIVHGQWIEIGYIDTPENFVAVRLTDIPSAKLSSDILRSYVQRSNQLQKERSKYLYQADRIEQYIISLEALIEEVWRAARNLDTTNEESPPT